MTSVHCARDVEEEWESREERGEISHQPLRVAPQLPPPPPPPAQSTIISSVSTVNGIVAQRHT